DDKVIVIVADKASQRSDEETGKKEILFRNGQRYEGVPGQQEFMIMRFREHGIPFEARESAGGDLQEEAMTLLELLETPALGAIAELQWRLSVPIMLLVLSLIAVPLSKAPPRQGRYNNLALGILVYLVYTNMLGASKAWVEDGIISPAIGLWWVHVLFILFAAIMLMRQNGIFRRIMAASLRRANANS
ncbi:MAG: LptF/LptG family permease, partial [Gammaproteobacteria bacterium]|nr:LptF/LptG family permease [Gammaproteobacteria bacterium]